jgi:hypothetical protein
MAIRNKPIYVTRRELYSALGFVWFYIFMILLLPGEPQWGTFILALGPLLMVIACLVQSIRSFQAPSASSEAELSERVKAIASDPSRKIEAIKAYRDVTGASLADAKAAVEAFINNSKE